jgi:hypothetical protein
MVRHRAPLNPLERSDAMRRRALCTSLCMNGGQHVDDGRNPGGNEKVRGITLCFSKYPLTRGFVESLLILVPESAADRSGEEGASAQPTPLTRRSGVGARTVFTATSNRADGLPWEPAGDDESAGVTGNRGDRRVRPDRRHLRVPQETETCRSVRRTRGNSRPANGAA